MIKQMNFKVLIALWIYGPHGSIAFAQSVPMPQDEVIKLLFRCHVDVSCPKDIVPPDEKYIGDLTSFETTNKVDIKRVTDFLRKCTAERVLSDGKPQGALNTEDVCFVILTTKSGNAHRLSFAGNYLRAPDLGILKITPPGVSSESFGVRLYRTVAAAGYVNWVVSPFIFQESGNGGASCKTSTKE